MITSSYYDNELLKCVTDFYLMQIGKPNLINFFNIYYTNNIMEDIKLFNNGKTASVLVDGVTILPNSKRDIITILINEDVQKELQPQYIIHELCHMYDFILFANQYCDNKLHRIRKHKYLSTLLSWSEFHVQLYVMPYYYAFLTYLSMGKINYINKFQQEIDTIYYKGYTSKLLNKRDVSIVDIMYYLGEITMCNQNDKNKHYNIDNEIIDKYPFIDNLYYTLEACLTFESFCDNLQTLYLVLNPKD